RRSSDLTRIPWVAYRHGRGCTSPDETHSRGRRQSLVPTRTVRHTWLQPDAGGHLPQPCRGHVGGPRHRHGGRRTQGGVHAVPAGPSQRLRSRRRGRVPRSEERRVGKECRSRWSPAGENTNTQTETTQNLT